VSKLDERRAPIAALIAITVVAMAARVAGAMTLFAQGDVPLDWRVPFALLGAATAVLIYPWLAPTHRANVPILACGLIAIHPTLVAATTQSTVDVPLGAVWVVLILLMSRFHQRFQWTMTIVLAIATVLRYRQLTDVESQDAFQRLLETWRMAPQDAPLKTVLAAYLFDGTAYLFAAVGLFYALRKNASAWVLPLAVFAFTVLVGSTYPNSAARASVFPIILALSAEGLWRVYAGLGRSGGHGILAIDPPKKGKP